MRAALHVTTTLVATATAVVTSMVGGTASAAVGEATSFVVDTQFVDGPSDVVAASGPLAACTQVLDSGGVATAVGPRKVQFSGEKTLLCDGGDVVIHYDAVINAEGGRRTFGDWYVVSSTLDGVEGGSGTVKGDNRTCTVDEGSGGCITDTFSGRVY